MSGQHVYTQELSLAASVDTVWGLLSRPGGGWCHTVKHKQPGITSGSSWQECHHGAFFLRECLTATVMAYSPDQHSMALLLDDGFNLIQQQLTVVEDGPSCCRIITRLACFQRKADGSPPVPSEKLAVMWRKADKRLASLAAHINSSAAAAGAAASAAAADAPPAVPCTLLVPV